MYEHRKSEDVAAKYKHCRERLRQEKGALEVEKKALQCRLAEVPS